MIRRKQIWDSGPAGSFSLTADGARLAKKLRPVLEKLFTDAAAEGFSVREVAHLIVNETGSVELMCVLRLRVEYDDRRRSAHNDAEAIRWENAERAVKNRRRGGKR
jgi:hypothetical protein